MCPSGKNYIRDYAQEQVTARARGETKDRAKRNAARAKLKKSGVNVSGKDVDHKKGIRGGNGKANLRTQSKATNRAAGGRKGNTAGKASGARKGHKSRGKK